MPTDPEVRDKYLRFLQGEEEARRAKALQLREQVALAKLENDAQALLNSQDRDLLNQIGITDRTDFTTLNSQFQGTIAERDAIRRLADHVRTVP